MKGKKWIRPALFTLGGALAGLVYYLLIGCSTGSCAITSNPVRAMAYMMAAGVTILCIGAIIMTRGSLAGIFGVSSQVQEMYETVILYFAAGLVFAAFLRVTTSYFYAVEQNLSAYILIYGEPSLLAVLIALVLPGLLGLSGVWIAEPVTQASLALAGGLLLARSAGRSSGNRESQIQ